MFEIKPVDEIVKIVESGGSFKMEAFTRSTSDLIKIAQASGKSGSRIIFGGLNLDQRKSWFK